MNIPTAELSQIEAMIGDIPGKGVTAADLGEWLGLTAARVNGLARDGKIPRRPDGTFNLQPAVRGYVETIRNRGSALASNPELNLEKIRLARANAEKVEAANARARGDLAPLAEVERAWAGILRDVRAALLALPSRTAARLCHLTPHDILTLEAEVRCVLSELANDDMLANELNHGE